MTLSDGWRALTTSSSTPAVLVPGLGLDARSWDAVRRALGGPSVVVTLPSMGVRPEPDADLHVEQQSRRLLEALPREGELTLVGHSASCPVVVEAATRSPRVTGLVLVGPATDPRAHTWPQIARRWLATAVHERLWEPTALVPQYRVTGPRGMVHGMTQARRYRTDIGLSAVTAPTLVIRGEHDHTASTLWCDDLARIAGTTVITVPRAAHMVPLTHPQVVAEAVKRLGRERPSPVSAGTVGGTAGGARGRGRSRRPTRRLCE